MLDWGFLVFNSLWVIAASLVLAAVSHASWTAALRSVRVTSVLYQVGYRWVFTIAGFLFCVGLAGNSGRTWQMGVWILGAVLFLIELCKEFRKAHLASRRS